MTTLPERGKGSRGAMVEGGSRVDLAVMTFQMRDSYIALLRNCGGFSEASGTL
jgi:hypothetical protein